MVLPMRLRLVASQSSRCSSSSSIVALATVSFAEAENSILGNIGSQLRDGTENYEGDGAENDQVFSLDAIR